MFLGGKAGRCVGLTALPPSCADCLEIWEPQTPGTLRACPGLYKDCFTCYTNQTITNYQFSNDVELKLAKVLQLIGTIKRTIFKKVRKETILKIYNTLDLRTFLYGSENWSLTALQGRRIEASEMKLLRRLAGYTLYDTKQMTTYAANYGLQSY